MTQETYTAQVCGNHIMTSHIKNVLVKGENYPVTFEFIIDRTDLPDYCYLMYSREGDANPALVSVTKTVGDEQTTLTYMPTLHFCAVAGEVQIQLIACDVDVEQSSTEDVVNLTEIAVVNVADALVDPVEPEPMESIFTEYLSQFEQLKNEASGYASDAQDSAEDAEGYAQDAHDALSGLEGRMTVVEGKVSNLETPAEIQQYEIDAIFVS